MNIDEFKDVPASMLWRDSAIFQIESFKELAQKLGASLEVVGSHCSKSIALPVVQLRVQQNVFTMRDNFYDVNLHARLHAPCQLGLEAFFYDVQEALDWSWYLGEIDRARGYSWRKWTDEQMDDHFTFTVVTDSGLQLEKTPAEKQRWRERLKHPLWYERDWSSGVLTHEGEFAPGVKIFRQTHPFAEGIPVLDRVSRVYRPGRKEFIISLAQMNHAEIIIQRINASLG